MGKKQDLIIALPLRHYVVDVLRERIYNNELKQGQRLLEPELASEFEISRSTLREALQKLENDGLVISKQRRGSYVYEFLKEDLIEIYDARIMLETYGFVKALQYITDKDFEELELILLQMEQKTNEKDLAQFIDLDLDFHEYIMNLCHNSRVINFYSIIKRQIRVFQSKIFLNYNSSDVVLEQHRELLKAIKTKKPDVIADIVSNHIDRIK